MLVWVLLVVNALLLVVLVLVMAMVVRGNWWLKRFESLLSIGLVPNCLFVCLAL